MKVLLTGNNGYIGPVLNSMLKEHGYDTVGLDSMFFKACVYGSSAEPDQQVFEDLRDFQGDALHGVDAVIHLAALSNDPIGDLDPGLTEEINYRTTVRLAEYAKAAGAKRFLYASSCSMYGVSESEALTESAPMNPVTAYARSKVASENTLSEMADENFSPTYLRNATAYGVSPKMRNDIVVNNLTGWAVTTGKVKIMSDGEPWRPIVHVEDISRAFLACLEAPLGIVHNEAFNVGRNEDNYRIKDIARMVEKIVPNCQVEFLNQASPDQRTYNVDFEKIHTRLPGFKPEWNLEKGVIQIYESFKNRPLTFEEFEGHRFIRLKHLKHLIQKKQLNESLRWISG